VQALMFSGAFVATHWIVLTYGENSLNIAYSTIWKMQPHSVVLRTGQVRGQE